MGFISGLLKITKGAAIGVATVTALPIFGAVGTITAVGIAVGVMVGAAAVVADKVMESKKRQASSDLEHR
jgi:hypothetical protein